jgi:hypothetical protein
MVKLVKPSVSCYVYPMTIEQTVEIPASHRLVIDVPREVPAGRAILRFTSVEDAVAAGKDPCFAPNAPGIGIEGECPYCAAHNWTFSNDNPEAAAARQEVQDRIDGKIPVKRFSSFEEFLDDLKS